MSEANTTTGTCRFCGQNVLFEAPEGLENLEAHEIDKALEEMAARNCTCEAGKMWRKLEEQKGIVTEQIEALFANDHQAVGEILIGAIDHVALGRVKKVTVKAGEATAITGMIMRTKDGLRAEREDKATAVVES